MKRIITGVLALAVTLGLVVAVNATTATTASAVPAASCDTVASTQNYTTWGFNSTFRWHYSRRLNTSPGCNQIYFRSEGWRFDYYQCGEMWVRRFNSDGTSYVVDGSRKRVCGGTTVMLISRIAGNRPFRVEGWSDNVDDRVPQTWPIGTIFS